MCGHCDVLVTDPPDTLPDAADAEAWRTLGADHTGWCLWVVTRGFTAGPGSVHAYAVALSKIAALPDLRVRKALLNMIATSIRCVDWKPIAKISAMQLARMATAGSNIIDADELAGRREVRRLGLEWMATA